MSKFVKTKKIIQNVVDGSTPNSARISVVGEECGVVEIVVGARYKNKTACHFEKKDVADLISILIEIHEAMEDLHDQ
jgi:hypothetical protein